MSRVAIVTGAAGLIGSESVRSFAAAGYQVIGVDNDMRKVFFGEEASTAWNRRRLQESCPGYRHVDADIRDASAMERIFSECGSDVQVIIHAAAQPSHDWAARDPMTDFSVNATGTLILLEATRRHSPNAVFIYLSTNKVYGDQPNRLPLVEEETRWEVDSSHPFAAAGIDESMSVDGCIHSLFGVSKLAADQLVQEYGRYFGMKTTCFRGGCLTGGGHSGTELHGFLAYLVRCALTKRPYRIFGYKGKQVRDNIHSADLVGAIHQVVAAPRQGEYYNMGGSRYSHCSMIEAIEECRLISGVTMDTTYVDEPRIGDHIWYVSDVSKFQSHYPDWSFTYDLKAILREICEETERRL